VSSEETDHLADAVEAELGRRSLHTYIQQIWPILEPKHQFVDNWHIGCICDHLEALRNNEIRNLLVNVPPRFMKSLLFAVGFPTWMWIDTPAARFVYGSYAAALSTRDAVKARRVIESAMYQRRYGHCYQMTTDQNVKNRYENNKTGHRISTSVTGGGTGEGGDFIFVDDPLNALDQYSPPALQQAISWWDETMSMRLDNPRNGHKCIVMQRLAEGDLSGHVIEKYGSEYEVIMIPMRFERDRKFFTSIGWEDPRTVEGELAWPARYPEADVKSLETVLGSYSAAGQLQQRPAPLGGGLIKSTWFPRHVELPTGVMRVSSLDCASTGEANSSAGSAYTARLDFAIDPVAGKAFLHNVWREQLEYPELRRATKDYLNGPSKPDVFIIENKSAGIQLAQDMKADARKANIVLAEPTKDKVTRMILATPELEAGRVSLPTVADWLVQFLHETSQFPSGSTKDMVDCLSQFIHWWKARNFGGVTSLPVVAGVGQRRFNQASTFRPNGARTAAYTGRSNLR
jgi:predicted phage terminase large subunit-like protein